MLENWNNEVVKSISLPDAVHRAIHIVEREYSEQLWSRLRYAQEIQDESHKEWVRLLGPDVLFATHPYVTLQLVEEFVQQQRELTERESCDLRVCALIHDWGELTVDGEGVGDVAFPKKTVRHEREEYDIFDRVVNLVDDVSVREYVTSLYEGIVKKKDSKLGTIFGGIEKIGYMRTGVRVYRGVEGVRIAGWKGLVGSLLAHHIPPLTKLAGREEAFEVMLNKDKDNITKMFQLSWGEAPLYEDGTPAYDLKQLGTAQVVWNEYC